MIRHIGNRNVVCPKDVSEESSYRPECKHLACPAKRDMLWLEVFPRGHKEIAFYGRIDKRLRCHGESHPHKGQSPLLIQMGEARRLGLV